MPIYIDTDKVHAKIYRCYCDHCDNKFGALCGSCNIDDILDFIDGEKGEDVQEVKHGRWKQIYNTYPRYVCTSCDHLFNNNGFRYCPNCGARMDGYEK